MQQDVIRSFLNESFSNPLASKNLLVVIRKLWFSDIVFQKQLGELSSASKSRIIFRAETYIKENAGYIPLASFDTIITSPKAIMDIAPFRLPSLLTAFVKKISSLDINSAPIKARPLLSYSAIDSFSNKIFLYPIDTTKNIHKGV